MKYYMADHAIEAALSTTYESAFEAVLHAVLWVLCRANDEDREWITERVRQIVESA